MVRVALGVDSSIGVIQERENIHGPVSYVLEFLKTDYIRVLATTNYIDVNGGHVFPFGTWGNASTTVVAAVNAAIDGGTILVSNGAYAANNVQFVKGITMRGVNGASSAVISGGNRILISHSNAVLEQMTVQNASGITMSDGTIRDCIISNNYSGGVAGGGIRMISGLTESCVIRHNRTYGNYNGSSYGGGVNISGGVLRNCDIAGNQATVNVS